VCTRCEEGQRECIFESRFRFKRVQYVDTSSQGVRSRTHLNYEDDQPWVPTRKAVRFIREDGAGAEYGTVDFIERGERDSSCDEVVLPCRPRLPEAGSMHPPIALAPVVVPMDTQQADLDGQSHATGGTATNSMFDTPVTSPSPSFEPLQAPPEEEQQQQQQQQQQQSEAGTHLSDIPINPSHISAIVEDYTPPASLADPSRRHESGHRLTWGTGEYGLLLGGDAQESPVEMAQISANITTIELSHREALLMQHFIQKLAPWMDCCDPVFHFGQEVPRRAVRIPMLLYAVLALSSRHQSLLTKSDANEGLSYHGRCLKLVIRELSKPESSYDDNLVATMVCMRVYEALDNTSKADKFLHLQGVGRLLRAVPTFARSGGLAEAASWQALRQDVYVSIRDKIQPSFDLDNYGMSRVFDFSNDGACANVIILIFGRILRHLYSPSGPTLYDAWREIEHHVQLWDAQRARVFQPLFVKKANPEENQPFPIVHLMNPAQGKHGILRECWNGFNIHP
jgi:hypothetical protein